MTTGGGITLASNSKNDIDEIRAKGIARVVGLAEWLNSNPRPHPDTVKDRIMEFQKDFQLSEEDVMNALSDATMAIQKGKSGYDYIREGKPSHFVNIGRYLSYLKGMTQKEYESAKREGFLSDEAKKRLLSNPNTDKGMSEEQKQAVINSGKRPNASSEDLARGFGRVF